MQLSPQQITSLDRDGFLTLPDLFSNEEIDQLKSRLPALLSDNAEGNIIEKESGVVLITPIVTGVDKSRGRPPQSSDACPGEEKLIAKVIGRL